MRICLVAHGFPPVERTGVETYTLGLARALARAGQRVEVFVPRRDAALAELSLRREERDGFAVNWVTRNRIPASPREALLEPDLTAAFAAFLERERPEVVHFQHFVKLGIDLADVARERGIPTLYTAHDYYAICHRYTLLRPDLTRCDARGDSLACARCDRALGHLNALQDLGDYQMGALPEQLSPQDQATLRDLLAEPAPEGRAGGEALAAALEQRGELDRKRAQAYRKVDLLLSPSRFLIEELVRAGVERERIELQPFGFDNADLEGLPPPRRDPTRPLRFAFLGGLSKHKGVHVLLDAFAELRSGAELSIWGDSSDRPYVERLRRRTSEVGAQWRGPYERAELPGILAGVDALVLPSIWVENYPLVIREGFSAGRPVLASRVGALPESVRDGVDGLLFAPGDVADLARVLRRCVEEPELLATLAGGIAPVKGIDEHAGELIACYERLRARVRVVAPAVTDLASLQAPLARFAELSGLPTRELFARALGGLDELREAWAPELGPVTTAELLSSGLCEGSRVQDGLREAQNEIAWLRSQHKKSEAEVLWLRAKREELERGREELLGLWNDLESMLDDAETSQQQRALIEQATAYVRQKEAEVLEAHARQRALEELVSRKNVHLQAVEDLMGSKDEHIREVEQLVGSKDEHLRAVEQLVGSKDERIREVERLLGSKEEHIRAVERQLQSKDEHIRAVEGELGSKEEHIRSVERELQSKDEHIRAVEGELGSKEEHIRSVEGQLGSKEEHVRAVEGQLGSKEEHIRAVEGQLGSKEEHIRSVEGELGSKEEHIRAVEGQLGSKEEHIRAVEGQLLEAGRYIRSKDQEYADIERELRAAAQHVGTKESELRTARTNLSSLEGGTRSVAELGLTALELQERMLGRLLRPILRRLHRIQQAEGEALLPAEGAPLIELLGALRQVLDGLGALDSELAWRRPMEAELIWRRERMERLLLQAQRTFWRLSLAWTPVGRELRDWREPTPRGGAPR